MSSEQTIEHDADDDGRRPTRSRRGLLAGLAVGGAAVVGGAAGTAVARGDGVSFRRESMSVEIAVLGDTFQFSATVFPTSEADFRVPFLVEGWIYPVGTIGGDGFIPVEEGSIGRWFCRGWQLVDETRPEPHVASNQMYVFGDIRPDRLFPPDHLSSEGLEGTFGTETATRSIVGGSGRYLGATGSIRQTPFSINTTVFADGSDQPAPNSRFDFDLIVVDD